MTWAAHEPPLCAGYADARLLDAVDGIARYGAIEQGTGRHVVLKVADAGAPAFVHDALAKEATILAALGAHPNIITIYQQIETRDGRPALVLQRCLGAFAELFHFVPTPLRHALELSAKLAGALETVHRGGVLHCGVRPQNLLLSDFAEPVLANFESAVFRSESDEPAPLLHDPTVHTAPELLLGDRATEATDVYGLAVTLFWLVTGHGPFRSYEGDSAAATSARVLCDTVTPLPAGTVPPDVTDLLQWGLARDPRARPPSPIWFAEELGRIEQRNGWARTPLVVGSADVPTGRQGRRRRRPAAVVRTRR